MSIQSSSKTSSSVASENTALLHSPSSLSSLSSVPYSAIQFSSSVTHEAVHYAENCLERYLPYIHNRPFFHKFLNNLSAGATVSLINIPLSISLAVAAQSNPIAGVITAIWAGFFAAVSGGSQFNIMGPTGALSGILAKYSMMWGQDCLPILAITSGLVMFLVWLLNFDRYVTFLPSGVAHGFTLGVAFLIAGGQISSICSIVGLPPHDHFFPNMYELFSRVDQTNVNSLLVFGGCWGTLYSLVRYKPKIPWSIGIAVVGVMIGYCSVNGILFPRLTTLKDKYGELDPVLYRPTLAVPQGMIDSPMDVIVGSLSIAFVGVLESLISGKIADGLTKTTMNQRQETFAVALANLTCGAAGGVPATAALARTALNIRSGATSKMAGIINAISSCLIALVLLPVFGYLPLCVVAALLFQVAVGMIEFRHLKHAFAIDRSALYLTLFVAFICLLLDPTAAIVLGAVIGLLRFAEHVATGYSEVTLTSDLTVGRNLDIQSFDGSTSHNNAQSSFFSRVFSMFSSSSSSNLPSSSTSAPAPAPLPPHVVTKLEEHTIIYRIVGDFTYISSLMHRQRIKRLDSSKHIILSLRYCYYMDLDGLDCLEEILSEFSNNNRVIMLCNISPLVYTILHKCAWFQNMKNKGLIAENVQEAAKKLQNGSAPTSPTTNNNNNNNTPAASNAHGRRLSLDREF